MPAERLSMRKIREILRLCLGQGLSHRKAAASVKASSSTISDTLGRAKVAGVGWPLPEDLDDGRLEALLYPPPAPSQEPRAVPDWGEIHKELRRKGVTLQLLWQQYKEAHPEGGYQYSSASGTGASNQVDVVLRQPYRAGEKGLVDFSGDGIPIVDPRTGEVTQAELFIAVLGASNFTYAEAFELQQLRCWIDGHVHAYAGTGCPRSRCRIAPRRACCARAGTTRISTRPTAKWPSTTTRRSSPQDLASLATRRRSKTPCW